MPRLGVIAGFALISGVCGAPTPNGGGQEPDGGAVADGGAADGGPTGTHECPLSNGTCPHECAIVSAWPVDTQHDCLMSSVSVTCTTEQISSDVVECCVHDGQIFAVASFRLAEPGYSGWRPCGNAEQASFEMAQANGRCPK